MRSQTLHVHHKSVTNDHILAIINELLVKYSIQSIKNVSTVRPSARLFIYFTAFSNVVFKCDRIWIYLRWQCVSFSHNLWIMNMNSARFHLAPEAKTLLKVSECKFLAVRCSAKFFLSTCKFNTVYWHCTIQNVIHGVFEMVLFRYAN